VNESLEDIPALNQAPGKASQSETPGALPETIGGKPEAAKPAEAATPKPEPQVIAEGTFTGLTGHSGQGTAKLIRIGSAYYVRLEDDFRVTNGPDLFVYFGRDNQYVSSARLGSLKGNAGGQNYEVPSNINPADFSEIWVWCRSFSVPFAKAILK
jgi:hypothetical protein